MNSLTQLPLFGTIEIPLTKGYVAIVDAIDADLIQFKWQGVPKSGGRIYAKRASHGAHSSRTTILMHRVILERVLDRSLLSIEQVDHADRNGLNNRRDNLRLSTPTQNQQNQRKHIDSENPYKNIWYWERKHSWVARISVNGKRIYLGLFKTPEAAYTAYCDAAVKYHGEFARFK